MPLRGIRVVELGYFIFAPFAAETLAEYGADVIKLEQPEVGDPARGLIRWGGVDTALPGGRSYLIEHHNANKRSITVDLHTSEGKEIAYRLIDTADVFLHNLRSSAACRLGLDYETLSARNNRLIYAEGSGYGPRGPEAERIGYDILIQARTGLASTLGQSTGGPLMDANAPFDLSGGTLLAFGIVLALLARDRLNVAQRVDVSLLGAAINQQRMNITAAALAGREFEGFDRRKERNVLWNCYRCGDGRWIFLGMPQSDRYWATVCSVLGRPDLATDERFKDWERRDGRCTELIAILDEVFATRSSEEWARLFASEDLGFELVNNVPAVLEDRQALENGYIVDFDHVSLGRVKAVGPLIQLSETPGQKRSGAPELGEHTERILLELGYSWDQIVSLRQSRVI